MNSTQNEQKKDLIAQVLEYDIILQFYMENAQPIPEKVLSEFSVKELEELISRQEAKIKFFVDEILSVGELIN